MINLATTLQKFNGSKLLPWGITNIIAILMLIALISVPSKPCIKQILFYSGYLSAIFLLVVLALNPLKVVFPQSQLIKKMNKYRREIGVASFSHALIHVICFL